MGTTTGIFENVSVDAGDASLGQVNSAVVVRADFDLDGDQDLIVGGIQGDPHAASERLCCWEFSGCGTRGNDSNRDGIGAWCAGVPGRMGPETLSADVYGGSNPESILDWVRCSRFTALSYFGLLA